MLQQFHFTSVLEGHTVPNDIDLKFGEFIDH